MTTINTEPKYIKNTQYKDLFEFDAAATRWHKGFDLVFDGYLFQRFRENKPKNSEHSLNWRCVCRPDGCMASVTISLDSNMVSTNSPHSFNQNKIK